jgi:hypothetical protein
MLSKVRFYIKILLGDFNAKVGRKDIFKPKTGKESLHKINNDNEVRVVNFGTSKYLSKICSHIVIFINLLEYLLM